MSGTVKDADLFIAVDDFSLQDFEAALEFFAARERRFGGVTERVGAS